ncbi:hypothetical protein BDY19DRAFT_998367 [Irpex rosettiformis]|uniref:Uncharacterized protein n=1 Tax=Irpex rosettiformis TaxID=378272 RepID=A0ACB8TNW3_9APHY|nr:hypothetical protein BDY19DRAFT_998367 [Irpex rosettiformis]
MAKTIELPQSKLDQAEQDSLTKRTQTFTHDDVIITSPVDTSSTHVHAATSTTMNRDTARPFTSTTSTFKAETSWTRRTCDYMAIAITTSKHTGRTLTSTTLRPYHTHSLSDLLATPPPQ